MNSAIQTPPSFLRLLCQEFSLFSTNHLLQIHSHLITTGLINHQSILLNLFHHFVSKPSLLDHATQLFDQVPQPDAAAWRAIIRRYASGEDPTRSLYYFRNLQWREKVQSPSPSLDSFTFASAIKACGRLTAIREGKSIHCRVLRCGSESVANVCNTLIHFYSISGCLDSGCHLFDISPCRNIVTVNCLLSGFLKRHHFHKAVNLFNQLLDSSTSLGEQVRPNGVTLMILISGCTESGDLYFGKSVHAYYCKFMGCSGVPVDNSLIDMYASFGCIDDAEILFHCMPEKDLVSWNSLIDGYVKNGKADKAISLFEEMRSRGLEGDKATLVSLISACIQSKNLHVGKWVHAHVRRRGNSIPIPLATALINMYSKCGLLEIAREIFNEMSFRNIVSWNSMILAYVENRLFDEALNLFEQLQIENLTPDDVTMLALISACQNIGSLDLGDRIFSYIQRSGLERNTVLCNSVIDMYAKFGCIDKARHIFNEMPERDVVSWTSIIVGYANNGEGRKALDLFHQMRAIGIKPNHITFVGVLSACDHAGLVDDGVNMYTMMFHDYGIKPEIEHCGCMIDMFARAGLLEEACTFVADMPVEPNAVVWRMLIGACRVHRKISLGENIVDRLIKLKRLTDPEDSVISSNTFAEAERWDDVLLARKQVGAKGLCRTPGLTSMITSDCSKGILSNTEL
ncbi:pentatricopeptide repeat-containing protein At1g06140, mitochondrial-like [Typha angustifolia]|uniref:pentatricopeptide repeat-containing protein At1g06140, mitochondrial-like n=1 Tax=Typha angustifolia TaxID=59011 RepID=UPI003C2DF2F5